MWLSGASWRGSGQERRSGRVMRLESGERYEVNGLATQTPVVAKMTPRSSGAGHAWKVVADK